MTETPQKIEVFERPEESEIKRFGTDRVIATVTGLRVGVKVDGEVFSSKLVLPVCVKITKVDENIPAKKPFYPTRIKVAKWHQRRIAHALEDRK